MGYGPRHDSLNSVRAGSETEGATREARWQRATVSTVTVIPLNGTNYLSWKVQCRMVLMREGLWGIVAGTEEPPDPATDAAKYAKYILRRDRALATIVLAVDPSLLYLLGDPVDPAAVWKKLSGQFQKKT